MKGYFANLNSTERRFVVVVLLIVFTAVNAWLVWPRFSDWKVYQSRRARAQDTVGKFEQKIAQKAAIEAQIRQFESEGASVLPEDQGSDFARAIISQAAASGVTIIQNSPQPERTNQFFVERSQALVTQSTEAQFVDFLYKLGSGNSLVRVRGLSLGPDAPRQNLKANLTLVCSYQKKAPVRPAPAAPAPKSAAPVPKPASGDKPPASGVPKPSTPPKK